MCVYMCVYVLVCVRACVCVCACVCFEMMGKYIILTVACSQTYITIDSMLGARLSVEWLKVTKSEELVYFAIAKS